MKIEYAADVKSAFEALKAAGAAPKWGAALKDDAGLLARRTVFAGELRQIGIKAPDRIAIPSVRNDAAFLTSVVAVFSVVAVVLGQLPGDWGFFSAYLSGGVVLVVLAIGSTAPGLLAVVIDLFSQVWPDYRQRVVAHEAAHLLVGYLVGVPVTGYSVALGREHVEFAEAQLGARIIERSLDSSQVDALALVSVAGIAAEGLAYEEVMGQTADLSDLQRILLRSKPPLSDAQQQSVTRWAVWAAAALLKRYTPEFEAVQALLASGASVKEVVKAIEAPSSSSST